MRVNELDILRFIAALGVVFHHYIGWFSIDNPQGSIYIDASEPISQYGFLGVPLFFMISGYVILSSAVQRTNFEFAISRIARLYPVYWLCVSLTACAILIFGGVEHDLKVSTYLFNLTMFQSFIRVESLDIVYWTLAKEIQFYFCVFLLLSFGVIHYVKRWISIWLFLTLTFAFFKQPFFMGWFITPEYSAFFIAGICFYMLKKGKDVTFYNSCLICSFILGSISIFNASSGFLSQPTLYEKMFSLVLIAIFYIVFRLIIEERWKLKQNSGLLVLGALTYPLYLLHNVIGKLLLSWLIQYISPELALVAVILFMLSTSYLIYHCFEMKIDKSVKLKLSHLIPKRN